MAKLFVGGGLALGVILSLIALCFFANVGIVLLIWNVFGLHGVFHAGTIGFGPACLVALAIQVLTGGA